ncbi:LysE family translocator [Aquibacillus koreensis]|uniref:LysE family translocator n=1 Tax=Aquibacillus koreensis TaxID=279446 RepID=A0A9X4AL65_9BACI|nr:LysE family translocator [Aquibacillus koreensis]MCT2536186.1 LysE family translocator [Aquibacillus koreensis]MDC3422110.1 LysE family translocator [Aquibacillus koreensis]
MSIFFSYVFLGLSLAAPIGPINAAQLDKGIKNGFIHAWFIGLGSVTADLIYMLAVYFGVVQFLEIPLMKAFLWSFGCFVLLYTGVESLFSAKHIDMSDKRNRNNSLTKTFFTGFFLSISNPLTILFWLGIYGSVLAQTVTKYDATHLALYSGAIILGLLLWDFTMALVASSFRHILTNNILIGIAAISGLSLIGFGLYFGYQAYLLIF